MSDIKKIFNTKMDVTPSMGFDTTFARKLQKERNEKKSLLKWWPIAGSGAVMLVLFLLILQKQFDFSHSNQQYVSTLLELEEYSDERATEDVSVMNDLTTINSDEI